MRRYAGTRRGRDKASDILELESQAVSQVTWMLGTKFQSSARAPPSILPPQAQSPCRSKRRRMEAEVEPDTEKADASHIWIQH